MNLSQQVKISRAVTVTAGAAGTDDINGATLDMAGYDGVLMVVTFGAIVSNAVTKIKAQHGDQSNLGDAVDLAGTLQTVADDDDEKVFYIDLVQPLKRYVRVVVDRGTQNATCHGIYIQYGAKKQPTTQGTAVAGELHVSPAAGTA